MLGSRKIDTINNSDIYKIYEILYLKEKEGQEKLLQSLR